MGTTAASRRRTTPARPRPAMAARGQSIRWDRVARWALLCVLGVILLLYVSPAKNWIQQSRAASAQTAELHDLEGQNDRLKRQVRDLRRPAALDREARRLGMVAPNERSFVIENLPRH
jgi:cell division protein FtsB